MVSHACNPSIGRPRREDCHAFRVMSDAVSFRGMAGSPSQILSRAEDTAQRQNAQDPRFDPQHLQNGSWIPGPGGTLKTANRKRQWLTQCTQWASRGQQLHFQFIIDLVKQMFLRPFTSSNYPFQQRRVSPDRIESKKPVWLSDQVATVRCV